jgi:hypothetical protein
MFGRIDATDRVPSVCYAAFCHTVAEGEPLLRTIKTVHLSNEIVVVPLSSYLTPQDLRGSDTLILSPVVRVNADGVSALEQWLISRHRDGDTFITVGKCVEDARALYDRLVVGTYVEMYAGRCNCIQLSLSQEPCRWLAVLLVGILRHQIAKLNQPVPNRHAGRPYGERCSVGGEDESV